MKEISKSKSKELEKIIEKFSEKFDMIVIERELVYGYIHRNNCDIQESPIKKEYLGTKEEYMKYREWKATHKKSKKKSVEEEKNIKAHKSFLESYKSDN